MDQIRQTVAKNINTLRCEKGMTQLELAERLNYSDKAISKWERAESMPDVVVLVRLAELFGVSLDQLVGRAPAPAVDDAPAAPAKNSFWLYRRGLITGLAVLCVWLIATLLFVIFRLTGIGSAFQWLVFLYAVPCSLIVLLVFNSIWFNSAHNYLVISALMWSILAALFLTLLSYGINIWLVFLLGVPGQIIILLWSGLGKAGMERLSRRLLRRSQAAAPDPAAAEKSEA